jgi:hypothetical protein
MDICAVLDSVVNDRIKKSTNVHYENMQNYKGQKENFQMWWKYIGIEQGKEEINCQSEFS